MDFDFQNIAVPFRMQPGLRRLPPGARQLTPLAEGSVLFEEKRRVVEAGESRFNVPGFDPAPALAAIARKQPFSGPLELAFEEDFAVLDGDGGTLSWLCICVPSHWAPEEKVGLPLAAVHAPVADNAMLVAASQHLVGLVTSGDCFERFVWTVTPSARHDQHPRRRTREPWHDDPAKYFLRAERQTFFPVGGGTRQAVFTIRVMIEPLPTAVDSAAKAHRLHDAITTMSPAVLDYKNLAAAREPLLRWLKERAV